jgi:arsenate reductase
MPAGKPNPFALSVLSDYGITPQAPRSKSWNEFAAPGAPVMDVVVTVCDNAAGEVCPIWPMQGGKAPRKLHWSFPDPAAAEGSDAEKRAAFDEIFANIRKTIDAFLAAEPS